MIKELSSTSCIFVRISFENNTNSFRWRRSQMKYVKAKKKKLKNWKIFYFYTRTYTLLEIIAKFSPDFLISGKSSLQMGF